MVLSHSAIIFSSLQQPVTSSLPSGWVALQDPTSGRTYYANQTTGESSWEMPQSQPAVSAPTTQQPSQPATSASNGTSTSGVSSKVANKYGDGFVTSASNPQLAERYGNVGTR